MPDQRGTSERVPHVVSLAPAPGWLRALTGHSLDAVVAWVARDAGVWVRGRDSEGRSHTLRLGEDRRGALVCERPARDGKRRRLALDEHAADARQLVARLRWVASLDRGVDSSEHHRPSEEERAYGLAYGALTRLGQLAESELEVRGPFLWGLRLYLDLLAGRFTRPFESMERAPAWLAPALRAIRGDVQELGALARQPAGGEGAAGCVAATAFGLTGHDTASLAAYQAAEGAVRGRERADLCVRIASLSRTCGDTETAIVWARRALLGRAPSDDTLVRAARELVACGALDDARAVLEERAAREPFDGEVALALGELYTWAGRGDEARTLLAAAEGATSNEARRLRCLGAVSASEGRWPEARAHFDRVLELNPHDVDTHAWLAEAFVRSGDRESAERHLEASRARAQGAIHVVLAAAVISHDPSELASLLRSFGESTEALDGTPAQTAAVALDTLPRFGGNRGETLTRLVPGVGSLGIEVVELPEEDSILSSRDASAAVVRRLGSASMETLEAELDALKETYPASPHPLCYHGELALWLGDYDRAIGLFDEAMGRERARWAYVGKAAVMILRGDYDAADREIEECGLWFPPVAAATTDVYVGEGWRRRGEHARAIEHLSVAVRTKSGRVGAWLNLALSRAALGEEDEASAIFERLTTRFPGLFWDVWHALSGRREWPPPRSELTPLFERALTMMRGNRSSHMISYFDDAGVMRIARDVTGWREPLSNDARFLAMELRARLARGV